MEKLIKYTLPWFIYRYGEEKGVEKYEQRNKNRSEKAKGSQNGRYITINVEEFKKDVLAGISKTEICKKYNLSPGGSFPNKLRECFGETSLYLIRGYSASKELERIRKTRSWKYGWKDCE